MPHIRVNGDQHSLPNSSTVAQLVESLGLPAGTVAVELNRHVIPKSEHATTTLNDGDQVEIVTIVGGG